MLHSVNITPVMYSDISGSFALIILGIFVLTGTQIIELAAIAAGITALVWWNDSGSEQAVKAINRLKHSENEDITIYASYESEQYIGTQSSFIVNISEPLYVNNISYITLIDSNILDCYLLAENRTNKRKSNIEKHQRGQSRNIRDRFKTEKGDKRRPFKPRRRNSNIY